MSKKWIAVLAILGIVAVGITGGVVVAQSTEPQDGDATVDKSANSFAARVAGFLGLGTEEVEGAFQQARREMQKDRFKKRLDRMVDQGRLTQEQADEQFNWFQSRPDSVKRDLWFSGKSPQGFSRMRGWAQSHGVHGARFFGGRRGFGHGRSHWGDLRHEGTGFDGAGPGAPFPETTEPTT